MPMLTCYIFSGLDKAGTVNFFWLWFDTDPAAWLSSPPPPPSSRWVRNNEVSEGDTPFVFNSDNVRAFKNVLSGVQRAG